jgi:hypothetical protein
MPVWLIPVIRWLGHWVVYFVLSAIVIWGLYAGLVRPTTKPNPTTTVQSGGVVYDIKIGFGGCARIPEVRPNDKTVNPINSNLVK